MFVLKKWDLMCKKVEEEKKKEISCFLVVEGFELESEDE